MRVGLVVVRHHHVLVIRQLGVGELARGVLHAQWIGAARHRQHDVEGVASLTWFNHVVNQGAAETPVIGQVVRHRFLPRIVSPRSSSMSSLPFLLI